MKRMTVALLLCAFSVVGFVGCGGEEKKEAPKTPAAGAAPAAGGEKK